MREGSLDIQTDGHDAKALRALALDGSDDLVVGVVVLVDTSTTITEDCSRYWGAVGASRRRRRRG